MKNLKTLILILLIFVMPSISEAKTITLSLAANDTGQIHSKTMGFILKHGYGYDNVRYTPGKTIILLAATAKGSIDVYTEFWMENFKDAYRKYLDKGQIVNLGVNLLESWQGFLVPRYMVEGDTDRGIDPVAPDLKTVEDLKKYWKLFKDPEDPSKGRFYSCIPGWACEIINEKKFGVYGLNKYYNIFLPGSDSALAGSLIGAYKRGEPWFGYYWSPTWVLGVTDMYPISEPKYNEQIWDENYGCAYPSVEGYVIANAEFVERTSSEVIDFMRRYETSLELNNQFLAHMQKTDSSTEETVIWFLEKHPELWERWIENTVVIKKVHEALN